jgi:hypothetical protein
MSNGDSRKRDRDDDTAAPIDTAEGLTQGWHLWLHGNAPGFVTLRREMLTGWRTAALTERHEASKQFHTAHRQDGDLFSKKLGAYAQWAAAALRHRQPFTAATPTARPTFLDLGSAPGGLSQHLHGVLGWEGVAVSLAVADGGMPMVYRGTMANSAPAPVARRMTSTLGGGSGKQSALSRAIAAAKGGKPRPAVVAETATVQVVPFATIDGDITSTDFHNSLFCSTGDSDGSRSAFFHGEKIAEHTADFCMAGAVQDQGQRDPTAAVVTEMLRNRLAFFAAQLSLALRALKDGGALMFVFGPSECASLPLVVARLRPYVATLELLQTMHVDKSPVYVLCTGVQLGAAASVCNVEGIVSDAAKIDKELAACSEDRSELMSQVVTAFTAFSGDINGIWAARSERLERHRQHAIRDMANQ